MGRTPHFHCCKPGFNPWSENYDPISCMTWPGKKKVLTCSLCCLVAKSCLTLNAAPWTVAPQALLSMGFPSKNTGAGCRFLLPYLVYILLLYSEKITKLIIQTKRMDSESRDFDSWCSTGGFYKAGQILGPPEFSFLQPQR